MKRGRVVVNWVRLVALQAVVLSAVVLLLLGPSNALAAPPPLFDPAVNYGAGNLPLSVAVGDLDGDTVPDLAVANGGSNNVSVLLGTGGGVFGPAVNYPVGAVPYCVAIDDLNGDIIPDLAVANWGANDVSVLLGAGGGLFAPAVNYPAGVNPYYVAIDDLNGDTIPDLVISNWGTSDISVLLGTGGGGFAPPASYPVGGLPSTLAVGDLNADTIPDLAVANTAFNGVSVLLGTGGGVFAPPANYPTGISPYSVAIGDLNGDTIPDLAAANSGSNSVSILLGIGGGVFGGAVDYPVGTVPYSVAIGDLDSDTLPDLAVANGGSNDVSVLLGTGGGVFGGAVNYQTGGGPFSIAIGDLNADSELDMAVANVWSNDVSLLLNGTPPVTTLLATPAGADGDNDWYKTIPQIGLSSNEAGATYYQWDATSAAWNTYSTTLTASQGSHTLHYFSADTLGNTEVAQGQLFKVDTGLPSDPVLLSPSHTSGSQSNDSTVDLWFIGATDAVSGVGGYSVEWDGSPTTTPADTVNVSGTANTTTSPVLADGTWYAHLRTKDVAGNWTSTVHLGPFGIDTAGPTGTFDLDNGAAYTSLDKASADSTVTGVSEMRFNWGTGWTAWQPYQSEETVGLLAGDGLKTVWAQFRDGAGNVFECFDTIIVDTGGPSGSMTLNGGAANTNSVNVTAHSAVTGATQMRFNNGTLWSAWEPYGGTRGVTLTSGDGPKTVNAQYADDAGHVLGTSDSITLDTAGPTGTFAINNGAAYTTSVTVTANSAVAGADEMRFNVGDGWSAWQTYNLAASVVLPSGDGASSVRAEYRDAAGNDLHLADTITLDTSGPSGLFRLNRGSTYTDSTEVTGYSAVSGAAQMRFNNGDGWSDWESYSGTKDLTLPSGDGPKTVNAQYADDAGHVLGTSDSITLDTAGPTGTFAINNGAAHTGSVTVTANSAVAGADQMRFNSGDGWSGWQTYNLTATVVLPTGDGLKFVWAQYRDETRNTLDRFDLITLDTVPPTGSFRLMNGALYTRSTTVTAGWAVSGATQMRFGNGVDWTPWEAFGSTKDVTLAAGDGTKTATGQFRDDAGNALELADTIILDTAGPVCSAQSARIRAGARGSLRYRVNDLLSPLATVTIKIRTTTGRGVKTISLGRQATNTWLTARFRCTLARGRYRIAVYATDLAGNPQATVGAATLIVL